MRFIVENGVPFLIGGGEQFPITIKDGAITLGTGKKTDAIGYMTYSELIAKFGNDYAPTPKRQKKNAD